MAESHDPPLQPPQPSAPPAPAPPPDMPAPVISRAPGRAPIGVFPGGASGWGVALAVIGALIVLALIIGILPR